MLMKKMIHLTLGATLLTSMPAFARNADSRIHDDGYASGTIPAGQEADSAGGSRLSPRNSAIINNNVKINDDSTRQFNESITGEVRDVYAQGDTESIARIIKEMQTSAAVLKTSTQILRAEIARAQEKIDRNSTRNTMYTLSLPVTVIATAVAFASFGYSEFANGPTLHEFLSKVAGDDLLKEHLTKSRLQRSKIAGLTTLGSMAVAAAAALVRYNILTVEMQLNLEQLNDLKALVQQQDQVRNSITSQLLIMQQHLEIQRGLEKR
jgi:hypothetical protein